eukprot:g3192.t1
MERKKKKQKLADALAELTKPAPIMRSRDPEDLENFEDGMSESERGRESESESESGSEGEAFDHEEILERGRAASSAPEKHLRLRGEVAELAHDSRYGGRKVSRSELFPRDGPKSSESESDELKMEESSEEEEEEEEDSDSDSESEVERELKSIQEEDRKALMQLTRVQEDEVKRAKGTQVQKQTWEDLLELRIRLQGALKLGARLPRPEKYNHFCDYDVNVKEAFDSLNIEIGGLMKDLLECSQALVSANAKVSQCGRKEGILEPALPSADPLFNGKTWSQVSSWAEWTKPYQEKVIGEWDRKLSMQSRDKKKFKAINRGVLHEVAAVMKNKEKLVERSRMRRQGGERAMGDSEALKTDPEIFDDSDFYHVQLREFIESGSGMADPSLGLEKAHLATKKRHGSKKKANLDTRATKGRRLKFTAHPKLVGFMAPRSELLEVAESTSRIAIDDLLTSLFGRV